MTPEDKERLYADSTLYSYRLDDYQLPSLIQKVVKSMKKNEVCEIITTKIDKLLTNFSSEVLDQYKAFKEGDKVSFFIGLVHCDDKAYFYKLSVADKLAHVKRSKDIAGKFFKQ